MTDRAHMPATHASPNLLCYEELLAAQSDRYDWPVFDENLASSICYTSGTTGNPKGVLYSHRSTLLHTFAAALPDALIILRRDVILPGRADVPRQRVGHSVRSARWWAPSWCFPGPALDGKSLHELIEAEKVTVSAGVPTVWQGLLGTWSSTICASRRCADDRRRRGAAAGDAAHVRGEVRRRRVARVGHDRAVARSARVCALRPKHDGLDARALYASRRKQGRGVFGIDMKIVDPRRQRAAVGWQGVRRPPTCAGRGS